MEDKAKIKKTPARKKTEVPEAAFEKGKPEGEELGKWRQKLASRQEKMKYLQTAERYWYSEDWYGSEKRKNPA